MSVDAFEAILVMAVFLGAIVQRFSGFAFSAVAGAILLQVEAPGTLVFDRIDPHVFRQCFRAFLMAYALSTVLRPKSALLMAKARPVAVLHHLPFALPALFAGATLGLFLFGKVSDHGFRRAMSALLFVSGIALLG